MGTTVIYNGIRLENCILEQFEQTPQRDPSGTDILFHRFTISVSCLVTMDLWNASKGLTARPFVMGAGDNTGTGPAAINSQGVANWIRDPLTTDRQPFALYMEGQIMLRVDRTVMGSSSGAVVTWNDRDNGPKVKRFNIVNINRESFYVQWSVEVCTLPCDTGGTNSQWPVVNNRWSVTDSIDDTNRTTRRWRGLMRLAFVPQPADGKPPTAHLYRHLCVPPLMQGWRRAQMHFVGEPDGLTLGYEVVDEELACEAAPYPAVRMDVQHTKKFEMNGGVSPVGVWETITVELTGAAQVDRRYLIYRAMQITALRARLADFDAKTRLLRQWAFTENVSQNGCTVSSTLVVQTMHDAAGGAFDVVAGLLPIKPMGEIIQLPDPSDPDAAKHDSTKGIDFGPWGTGIGNLVATLSAQWQTPCSPGHAMLQGEAAQAPTPPAPPANAQDSTPKTESTWTPTKPDEDTIKPPALSDAAKETLFLYARSESELSTDHGWVGLPKAETPADPKKPCVVGVQLHAATTTRIVRMQITRNGKWPDTVRMKKFTDSAGVTHFPVGSVITRQAPEKLPDDTTLYTVDAVYRFTLDREYAPDEEIPVIAVPWDALTATDVKVPVTAWIEADDQNKGLA